MSALTPPQLRRRKRRNGAEALVMVTAYDEPGGRLLGRTAADLILVGDSVANVMLGHEDTLHVSTEQIAYHVAAVSAARSGKHVVGDMPWMSYHVSVADAVTNAATIIRAGAHSVKLEGGANRVEVIEALTNAEIPVMGHLGLTPQSMLAMGGFKVQGKTKDAVAQLLADAQAVADAGAYAVVVEGVPAEVGRLVTEHLEIPVIGIGAGPDTDGQVLVWHDLLGLSNRTPAKFVRQYADVASVIQGALDHFVADVRSGYFPVEAETYPTPSELLD